MPRAFFLSEAEIYEQKLKDEEAAKKEERRVSRGTSTAAVYDCDTCGLTRRCRSPKMQRYGKGKKGILLVGEAPGGDEDRIGRPFVGKSGKFLAKVLNEYGINMDRDCVRTNVIRCRPPKNRDPKPNEKRSCFQNLIADIEEVKPKLIICLGDPAVRAVLKHKVIGALGTSIMTKVHATVFPFHQFNSWVGCSYHPASADYNARYRDVFIDDMGTILSFLDKPLSQPLTNNGSLLVDDYRDVEDLLAAFISKGDPVAVDYETTSLSPLAEGAKLVTVSLSNDVDEGWCIWLNNPEWNDIERAFVYHTFKQFLLSDVPKIVQNFNMEELWSREHVGTPINNMIMDTMVASHVVNCRRGTTGLDYQVFRMTGDYYSGMVDKTRMAEEPIEKVAPYNNKDSRYTLMLFQQLNKTLNREGNEDLLKFYNFLHSCLPDLADLKERGMPVDVAVLSGFKKKSESQIVEFQKKLNETIAGREYKKKYEEELNIESNKQLKDLFYEIYDEKVYRLTPKKETSVDAGVIQKINQYTRSRYVKEATDIILDYKKVISFMKKLKEYDGLVDTDGKLHPSYLLNVAETYRSSTAGPNVQNMFKRDPELIKFRKIIIPTPGNILLEVDYDGLEVRTWCMVSGDRELERQLIEFEKFKLLHPGEPNPWDTHRRWGAKLFQKDYKEITKDERFEAKNSFVFAVIYGAVAASIAANMNMPVEHIEKVWDEFWEEYWEAKEWRDRIFANYEKNGYVSCITGFRRPGPLSDEQLFNTPVQGPAFHLVLDGLKRVNRTLRKEGFKSFPNSEIHDSITIDAFPDEVEDVIDLSTAILCSKRFDWQRDVPLSVSWEMGKDFYKMTEI